VGVGTAAPAGGAAGIVGGVLDDTPGRTAALIQKMRRRSNLAGESPRYAGSPLPPAEEQVIAACIGTTDTRPPPQPAIVAAGDHVTNILAGGPTPQTAAGRITTTPHMNHAHITPSSPSVIPPIHESLLVNNNKADSNDLLNGAS
jgi:hypothetical protein